MEQLVEVTGPPLITALLAVLGVVARQGWQRRSGAFRYERALDRAMKEAAFLRTWLEAHELTSSVSVGRSREEAAADLEVSYRAMSEHRAQTQSASKTGPGLQLLAGLRVILVKGIRSRRAKCLRVLYYACLVWTLCMSASSVSYVGENDPDHSLSGRVFGSVVGVLITGVLPTIGIRLLVLRAERRSTVPISVRTLPPPQSVPSRCPHRVEPREHRLSDSARPTDSVAFTPGE